MTHSAISDAAESMAQLRTALLSCSLEELERSIPLLTAAACEMRSLEKRLRSAHPPLNSKERPALLRRLGSLRRRLDSNARLAASGEALQQGWARLLGAAAGYTASGGAASLASSPLTFASRVSVTG